MKGIILLKSNYTYEGDIVDDEPHGIGTFEYANGDRYQGECKHGKPDGYGTYYFKSGSRYIGFFSYGRLNGIGTYEDDRNIYKGTWRSDKKHGFFYRTNKIKFDTYMQKWIKNKLINNYQIQYIQPDALRTLKTNPNKKQKKYQISYKGKNKQCIGCYENSTNATNNKCGHVVMCYECLEKCESCPICRSPIETVIKLFIS